MLVTWNPFGGIQRKLAQLTPDINLLLQPISKTDILRPITEQLLGSRMILPLGRFITLFGSILYSPLLLLNLSVADHH